MKRNFRYLVAAASLVLATGVAQADDLTGVIEKVDNHARTVTVQGIVFHTTDRTDYDDGLKKFEDMQVGQRIEIDFDFEDGRHIAKDIELEK